MTQASFPEESPPRSLSDLPEAFISKDVMSIQHFQSSRKEVENGSHIRLADSLPAVPQSILCVSFAAALLGFVATGGDRARYPWTSVPTWAAGIGEWLDPTIVQGLTVLVVTGMIIRYRYPNKPFFASLKAQKLSAFATLAAVILPLVFTYGLEVFWLKPVFSYDRPATFRTDSFLLSRLGLTAETHGTSCPSGFVVRQTWLVLLGFSYAGARSTVAPFRFYSISMWNRSSAYLLSLTLVATAIISFSRVAQNAHTVFDIAMGLLVGTYLFWVTYYLLATIRGMGKNLSADIVAISCVFLPVFLFYARRPLFGAISSVLMLFLLGFVHQLSTYFAQSSDFDPPVCDEDSEGLFNLGDEQRSAPVSESLEKHS